MPKALFELVKDTLFTSREEVLASPLIDKKTGNIQALDIPEERLKDLPEDLPKLTTEFEWRLVILLNRLASTDEEKPPLLFKGESEDISCFINKLIAYIPDELKPTLGWDTAFDGGNLTFYPIKIVGFKKNRPIGGNPIRIDMEVCTIEETPETSKFFLPYTPYEKWLTHCRSEVVSKKQIEGAYNLSYFLETGEMPCAKEELLLKRRCFASINKEVIESAFLKQCAGILGEIITRYILSLLTPEVMLDLIIEEMPPAKLVEYVEDVILKNRLTPEAIKLPLPDSIIKAGSYRLRLIERLWKDEVIRCDDLRPLEEGHLLEFIKYLLLTKWKDKDWVLDILREDEEIFGQLFSSYETKGVIEDIILKLILKEKNFKEIAGFIQKEVILQEKGFAFLRREIGLIEILEEALKKGAVNDREIKGIISWAKKRKLPETEFPYIKAFLYPKQGIPKEVLRDSRTKERLIKWFIQYHRYKVKELVALGLGSADKLSEIETQMKPKGWMEKIKEAIGLKEEK